MIDAVHSARRIAPAWGGQARSGADVPEGPAANAGMRSGDVILTFDGEIVDDTRELVRIVAETDIGRAVEVVVFRDGEEVPLSVEIGRLEETVLASAQGPDGDVPDEPKEEILLGLTVSPLTGELIERYGIGSDETGLVVVSVEEGSEAEEKGIREGDVIAEVGQEPVATAADMERMIKAADDAGRGSILLLVRREGAPRFVALSPSS
jgi:serine protease Do